MKLLWLQGSRAACSVTTLPEKPNQRGNSDPQSCTECDEIPKAGQAEYEDCGATDRKQYSNKPSTNWELVHADPGMTVF